MLSRISLRFCLIHFLAAYCLMYAFHYLYYTLYADFIWNYSSAGFDGITSSEEISYILLLDCLLPQIGLLISFIISLTLALRKKIWWVNTLLIFIVAGVLEYFRLLGWEYANNIFVYTIGWINKTGWVKGFRVYYALTMLVLLAAALWLYFSKTTNRFIASTNKPFISPVP